MLPSCCLFLCRGLQRYGCRSTLFTLHGNARAIETSPSSGTRIPGFLVQGLDDSSLSLIVHDIIQGAGAFEHAAKSEVLAACIPQARALEVPGAGRESREEMNLKGSYAVLLQPQFEKRKCSRDRTALPPGLCGSH